jgi:hypothetical protein
MQQIIMPLHHELKQTYRAESLGKWKNFISFCLLDDKHPEAEYTFVLSIYTARNNTKLITQSMVRLEFLDILQTFSGINRKMQNIS